MTASIPTATMPSHLTSIEARKADAIERIEVKRIPQELLGGGSPQLPFDVKYARYAYEVFVDGNMVAYLFHVGAWNSSRWRIIPLTDTARFFVSGPRGRKPVDLFMWLGQYDKAPYDWPTQTKMEADEKAYQDKKQAAFDERNAAREADKVARQNRKLRAAISAPHLTNILCNVHTLTDDESDALKFAISQMNRMIKPIA